nr:hypothetical protein [Tanacetum cinerariifolium]
QLKHGDTGVGWDTSTGALACSSEWGDEKIKENPDASGFRKKQPSIELHEACEQLFGGLLASGSVVVGPAMDQDESSEIHNVNHENVDVNLENERIDIDDDTELIQVWNHYSQRFDAKENDFYSSLMRDVRQEVPMSCPDEIYR